MQSMETKRITRSSTASLRSSVFEGVQENGRTYHRYKEGSKLPQTLHGLHALIVLFRILVA